MAVSSRDIVTDLGLSAAQLGILSGVFFYVFACAQIPLGPLIDRIGGRRMIILTGIVTIIGSTIFALSSGYWSALLGRVLLGFGTASILMGALKIYTNWFSEREFPRVSGYMIAAGNVGSLFATAPLAYAINSISWRPAFLAITVIQACAVVCVYLTVQDFPPKCTVNSSQNRVVPLLGEEGLLKVWKDLGKSADFWTVALFAYFFYANYMVLLSLWGGPYLMEAVGLDRSRAGAILLCTSCGFISGSLLLGRVIDLLGGSLQRTIFWGQSLLLAGMSIMLGPAEQLPIPLLAAVYFVIGLSASSGVIIYPLARQLVPRCYAATAMTAVNFFLLMGAATMQHIMGIYICSYSRTAEGYPAQAYHGAFLIPASGLFITLVLFLIKRSKKEIISQQ